MKRTCGLVLAIAISGLVVARPGSAETTVHMDEAHLMRQSFARFQSLSPSRQEQLRRLDREFQEWDEEKQKHYVKVMERYQTWLAQLPEADRKQVVEASTANDRLARIQRLREIEWVATLPKSLRDEYAKTEKRVDQIALIEKWHEEERARQHDWEYARDHWEEIHQEIPPPISKDAAFQAQLDVFLDNLVSQAPTYQRDYLHRLHDTPASERYWVWYRSVVESADKITLLPTPSDWKQVASFDTLPEAVKEQFKLKKHHKELQAVPQYWPAFAVGVTDVMHHHKLKLAEPLGPAKKSQMPKEVQPAIDDLWRVLDRASKATEKPESAEQARKDRLKLEKAEGKWPDYPQAVMELAKHYKVPMPGWTLPKPEIWDKIRKPTVRKDKT